MLFTVSPAGRTAIMQREGVRLKAYRDSVGVLTIGVGHTGRMAGPKVTAGMVITQAQADAFLVADLAPVEAAINGSVKAIIGQNQVDALASLAFNIGVGGFIGSTVVHKLNAGDVQGAADAFLMWERPAVLKTRREGERAQFLTLDVTSKLVVKIDMGQSKALATPVASAPQTSIPVSLPKCASSPVPPCARADCPLRAVAVTAPKPPANPIRAVLR